MLVQGNVRRVKKFGVVAGESGRGLNITLRNHNSPVGNSPFSHTPCYAYVSELPEKEISNDVFTVFYVRS